MEVGAYWWFVIQRPRGRCGGNGSIVAGNNAVRVAGQSSLIAGCYDAAMRYVAAVLAFAVLMFTFPLAAAPAREKHAISDDHIHDEVMRRLVEDTDVHGANLEVKVDNGAVTLTGRVDSEKARTRATKLTKKVRGVKSVNNQLTMSQ